VGVYRNETRTVGIDPLARTHHIFVDGKTGSGKSTFLINFIIQMIYLGNESVVFIDPMGDAVQHILEVYPEERINDLIYIDFSSETNPIALNVITPPLGLEPSIHTENLIEIFKLRWSDSWGPRMEWILREVILAMASINKIIDSVDVLNKVVLDKMVNINDKSSHIQ